MVKTLVIMIFYCQNLKRQAVIIKYYFLKNFLLKKHVQKHVIFRRKLCYLRSGIKLFYIDIQLSFQENISKTFRKYLEMENNPLTL